MLTNGAMTKRLKDMFAAWSTTPHTPHRHHTLEPHAPEIIFQGRTRREAKRHLIRYWSANQGRLEMGLEEFTRRCVLRDERTIIFTP